MITPGRGHWCNPQTSLRGQQVYLRAPKQACVYVLPCSVTVRVDSCDHGQAAGRLRQEGPCAAF